MTKQEQLDFEGYHHNFTQGDLVFIATETKLLSEKLNTAYSSHVYAAILVAFEHSSISQIAAHQTIALVAAKFYKDKYEELLTKGDK